MVGEVKELVERLGSALLLFRYQFQLGGAGTFDLKVTVLDDRLEQIRLPLFPVLVDVRAANRVVIAIAGHFADVLDDRDEDRLVNPASLLLLAKDLGALVGGLQDAHDLGVNQLREEPRHTGIGHSDQRRLRIFRQHKVGRHVVHGKRHDDAPFPLQAGGVASESGTAVHSYLLLGWCWGELTLSRADRCSS